MKFGLNNTIIKKIGHVFQKNQNVQEAIIFGSRAKGNFNDGSDIDIVLKGNLNFNDLLKIESDLDNIMLP